jgi:hypothetical protein
MTFWIGVLIGAMGGATFGALIMAIAAAAKRADDEIERDTRVLWMSDTTNPVQAESDQRLVLAMVSPYGAPGLSNRDHRDSEEN